MRRHPGVGAGERDQSQADYVVALRPTGDGAVVMLDARLSPCRHAGHDDGHCVILDASGDGEATTIRLERSPAPATASSDA